MAIVRSADHGMAWAGALVEPEKLGPPSEDFLALAKRLAVPPDEEAAGDGFVTIDGACSSWLHSRCAMPMAAPEPRVAPWCTR